MKKIWFVLVVLFLMPNITIAGSLKDEKDIRAFATGVMEKVGKGDLDGAFNALKPYVALSSTEIDSVAIQSKAQREQYGKRYVESIGFEFIDEKKVGESLIRLRYIEKTDKHALPWLFYFYKTPEGWTLNAFNWNDQFNQLFLTN